jgi:hypothetical protein
LLPGQLVLQEQRQPDRPATFRVRLAACRQAAVEQERPVVSARPVELVRPAVVVLERRAALVQLRPAVHSVAVVAAVVQAAVAQTHSTRSN